MIGFLPGIYRVGIGGDLCSRGRRIASAWSSSRVTWPHRMHHYSSLGWIHHSTRPFSTLRINPTDDGCFYIPGDLLRFDAPVKSITLETPSIIAISTKPTRKSSTQNSTKCRVLRQLLPPTPGNPGTRSCYHVESIRTDPYLRRANDRLSSGDLPGGDWW